MAAQVTAEQAHDALIDALVADNDEYTRTVLGEAVSLVPSNPYAAIVKLAQHLNEAL